MCSGIEENPTNVQQNSVNQEENNQVHNNDINVVYPATSIMLEISREEYSKERERANVLDNKASIFISAIIALITLYIPIIPFGGIKKIYTSSNNMILAITTIFIFIIFIAFICLIVAFYYLCRAVFLKPFRRVDFGNLNDDDILSSAVNLVEKGLIDHYHTILVANADINDSKAKDLSAGLKYSTICFILLILGGIGLLVITA